MKCPISAIHYKFAGFSALFAVAGSISSAQIEPPKVLDQPATVISHLSLEGAAITFIQPGLRRGRKYLLLQTAEHGFLVVNVTKPKKPFLVQDVNLPKDIETGSFQLMGHGLALVASSPTPNQPPTPKTIHVLDISHPGHPRVMQTFEGVTATASNFDSNLFFFANKEGLWILREKWTQPPVYPCTSSSSLTPLPNCE